MSTEVLHSTLVRGAHAGPQPNLLLEVPHGATSLADFQALRSRLRGDFPRDLEAFFCVNTDVGAPELATAIALELTARDPRACVRVVRCLIPRTFVDCNRVIDRATQARASAAGEMTPGLHAWVQDARDRELLLELYFRYRAAVEEEYAQILGQGGRALMVHSYAPRSLEVPVDEQIVDRLRAEYQPERIERWPLRADVDLIDVDPDQVRLCDPDLADRIEREFRAAGFETSRSRAYCLHPSSLAHHFAARYPGQTLCFEVRRDRLVENFTPFEQMYADPMRVQGAAEIIVRGYCSPRVDRI